MAQRLQALIGPDKAFDKLLAGRLLLPYVPDSQPSGLKHSAVQLFSTRGSELCLRLSAAENGPEARRHCDVGAYFLSSCSGTRLANINSDVFLVV